MKRDKTSPRSKSSSCSSNGTRFIPTGTIRCCLSLGDVNWTLCFLTSPNGPCQQPEVANVLVRLYLKLIGGWFRRRLTPGGVVRLVGTVGIWLFLVRSADTLVPSGKMRALIEAMQRALTTGEVPGRHS